MKKWSKVYWNDFKSFVRKHGLMVVAVVGCLALLQYSKVLAKAKDGYIQDLEQYVELLEEEQLELLETTQFMEKAYDALEEENQILGSYIAQHEIQYEQ